MISYVITMLNNSKSVDASERCIKSASGFGYDPFIFKAITPEDNPVEMFRKEKLPLDKFKADSKYSRLEPCMCCFLSHRELWKKAVKSGNGILVLEHDAIFKNYLPAECAFEDFVNLGKPSYGKYMIPEKQGLYNLFSKAGGYLPGTHAYYVSSKAAQRLLDWARVNPAPVDLFLNKNKFPWIKEYYPWPIIADDDFTTIQKVEGSLAKHNYGESYEIL
tara:strand:+ start:2408 stop:3064 length:657 start_codon:yes stop_codon:yes gene_type:complete